VVERRMLHCRNEVFVVVGVVLFQPN
jgi:hypothetical protein